MRRHSLPTPSRRRSLTRRPPPALALAAIFFCLYGGYKCFGGDRHGKTGWFVWAPTALVSLDEIDFDGGCREMDEMEAREQLKDQRPKNPLSRVLDYIF